MKTWLENTVQELVDHPGEVRIAGVVGERTAVYEVRCHPDDVGKVIGRNGKTISAIRALLSTLAARQKRQVILEVAE